MVVDVFRDKLGRQYELVPPEGGWGFIVSFSISLFFSVTIGPLCVFGLLFKDFLEDIGDKTLATILVNCIFQSVVSFTGLLANQLLQNYSCRKVGLLGAVLLFTGSFSTAFITSLSQFIFCFGIIQGIGFGLMMPASFTSFNGYFDKRKNVMMGIAQAIVVLVTIVFPMITNNLLKYNTWRETQIIFAGLGLNCILAMLSLQPVKWHMKKSYIKNNEHGNEEGITNGDRNSIESSKLLSDQAAHQAMQGHLHNILERRRPSVISIGSMAVSITNVNNAGNKLDEEGVWQKIYNSLDLGLFKSLTFINIAFGLSLALLSDLIFLSIYPQLLDESGFNNSDIESILTIYFSSDLVCRIGLSVVSALVAVRNRYVFLVGAFLSAIFRLALVLKNDLIWIKCVSGGLGFFRCFIQTPLPLVVAEEYGERFSTAFTLYMVVCGIVFTIFGPIVGILIKFYQSTLMVVHLLTAAYLMCVIPWILELVCIKLSKKK